MHIILIILLVLAALIVLLLIVGFFVKKEHYVKREIVINAPLQKVFGYLKLLKNQDKFNKWAMADPDRDKEFKGTDGTVGFTISWNGNKEVGEGQKEIINIVESKSVETQVRFVRPMAMVADIIFMTESLSADQTKVSMSNGGILKYPFNVMIPVAEKNFAKDIDVSLLNLKSILEKE